MSGVAASLEVDQAQVNRLLLDMVAIGERHGIRFPREYVYRKALHAGVLLVRGMIIKQVVCNPSKGRPGTVAHSGVLL